MSWSACSMRKRVHLFGMALCITALWRTVDPASIAGCIECTASFYSEKAFQGLQFRLTTGPIPWSGGPFYTNIWDFGKIEDEVGFDVEEAPPRSLTFTCSFSGSLQLQVHEAVGVIGLRLFSLPLGKSNGGRLTNYTLQECTYVEGGTSTCTSEYEALPGQDRTASGAAILLNFDDYIPRLGYQSIPPEAPGTASQLPPNADLCVALSKPAPPGSVNPGGTLSPRPPPPPPQGGSSPTQVSTPSRNSGPRAPSPSSVKYRYRPPRPPPPGADVPPPATLETRKPPVPPPRMYKPAPPLPPSLPGFPFGTCPPCIMPLDELNMPTTRRGRPKATVGSVQDSTNRCKRGRPKPPYSYMECNAVHFPTKPGVPVFASESALVLNGHAFPCTPSSGLHVCSLVLRTITLPGCTTSKDVFYGNLDRRGLAVNAEDLVQRGQLLGYTAALSNGRRSKLILAYNNTEETSVQCPTPVASSPYGPCPTTPCNYIYPCAFRASGVNCYNNPQKCSALKRCPA